MRTGLTKQEKTTDIWFDEKDPLIQDLINTLYEGISGSKFPEIADSLKNVDPYMVLADFRAYMEAQEKI